MAFGNDRRIDIDIVANDRSSRVYDYVGNSLQGMAVKVNNGIIGINKSLNSYNNAMYGMYRSTQIALAGSGYLFYRFTKDSIKNFADFERQHGKTMGAIASNYDRTAESQKKFFEDQKKLREESIRLGTLGPTGKGALYNPQEVAYAQTALAKAGTKPADMSKSMPTILKFAGGNDLDIETATDYAVNLSKMFNIPVEQWGEMLDKVTRTADISTIDVPDLFESLKYAGPIASSMGRDLTEVLSMVAVLGNVGLKGSIGGTGIQSLYTRLLSPIGKSESSLETAPDEYSKAVFEAFIKETTTADGSMKDMPTVTGMLDQVMEQLNDKQQAWFAHKLFGLFQMKAGFALSSNGGDKLQSVIDDINANSSGTNDRKWDIMLNTSWGKQEAFSNLMYGVSTDIGSRLTPITNAVLDELFNVISNKGNYKISFENLKDGISESARQMEEQYGVQIGNFTESFGNFLLNSSRVAIANEPLAEGFASGIAKLLNGDLSGALEEFGDGINRTNENISELPEDLQGFATQVRNAAIALVAISSMNFASRILESVTSLYRYTIGQFVKTTTMTVQAATVTIMDTGLLGADGKPIYTTGNPTNTTTTAKPTGPVILGTDGKPIKNPTPGTLIDPKTGKITTINTGGQILGPDGKPITSAQPTQTKPVRKNMSAGINAITWAYALGEMSGVNDMILNNLGVDGKGREAIDKTRTVANFSLGANFADDMIFRGAGKKLIKSASKSIYNGISAGFAESAAAVGTGTTAFAGGVMALGIASIMKDNANKNNTWDAINSANANGDSLVWTGKQNPWYDPNGIWTSDGRDAIINLTEYSNKLREQANRAEYQYPSVILPTGDKEASRRYQEDRQRFLSAQSLYYGETGSGLKYSDYMKSLDKWLNNDKIGKDGTLIDKSAKPFDLNAYMQKLDTYASTMRNTVVNVQPPNVDVNVTVDKSGNVTVNKNIMPALPAMDDMYRILNLRNR